MKKLFVFIAFLAYFSACNSPTIDTPPPAQETDKIIENLIDSNNVWVYKYRYYQWLGGTVLREHTISGFDTIRLSNITQNSGSVSFIRSHHIIGVDTNMGTRWGYDSVYYSYRDTITTDTTFGYDVSQTIIGDSISRQDYRDFLFHFSIYNDHGITPFGTLLYQNNNHFYKSIILAGGGELFYIDHIGTVKTCLLHNTGHTYYYMKWELVKFNNKDFCIDSLHIISK